MPSRSRGSARLAARPIAKVSEEQGDLPGAGGSLARRRLQGREQPADPRAHAPQLSRCAAADEAGRGLEGQPAVTILWRG